MTISSRESCYMSSIAFLIYTRLSHAVHCRRCSGFQVCLYSNSGVIAVAIAYISQLARGARKGRSNLCRDDAEETRMTEIEKDNGMSVVLDYSGNILEFAIKFCKPRPCQWKIKNGKQFQVKIQGLFETIPEQQTTSLSCFAVNF